MNSSKDLTFTGVIGPLSDPDRKLEYRRQLREHTEVIVDEHGVEYGIIPLKDCVLPLGLFESLDYIERMGFNDTRALIMRPDDVYICDYGKAGTTWVCNMIHYILQTGLIDTIPSFQPINTEMCKNETLESLPSPRVMYSHMYPNCLPLNLFTSGAKVISLYRNPKDTAVSLYHHYTRVEHINYSLSWNCHIEQWMNGKVPYVDYFHYHKEWEKFLAENKQVLLICYEDMKKAPLEQIRRIKEHLGLDLTDERLTEIIEMCSLKKLKKDIETGAVPSPNRTTTGEAVLYRKGIIGDWKNHFTVAQSEQLDDKIKATFPRDSIFKFQYT